MRIQLRAPSPAHAGSLSLPKGDRRAGEDGYILIAVLFLMVMILLTLSIAAPKVAADIQRDREIELIHRGKQYERAIKLYYKKFGSYPPTMEALEKSNEIRFLRKRYIDPATGKDEWHLIHFGEAKTAALGMFGQPIAGAGAVGGGALAGTGPGGMGQNIGTPIGGDPNANVPADPTAATGQNPAAPNSPVAPTDPNSPIAGSSGAGGTSIGGTAAGSSIFGSTGSGSSGPGGANGSNTPSIFGSSSTSGNPLTIGGGGIVGVESTSHKATILEYKKKRHFNEWEFVYDPRTDRTTVGGGSAGQPMSGAGNGSPMGGTGTNNPFGGTPGFGQQQQQQQQPSPPQQQ